MIQRLMVSLERFALIFSQPWRWGRSRVENWIMTRTPRIAGPWTINRRRVYILPTRAGYAYSVLLLVMLLGAMNYSNSMAFALTFLLAGLGLVGMHQTHGNLVNVVVAGTGASPVFAGQSAHFRLKLHNPSGKPRYALSAAHIGDVEHHQIDITENGYGELTLECPTLKRGWLAAPRFAVATRFPLGLFRAWTWVELDQQCLVYPSPAKSAPPPPPAIQTGGSRSASALGQDEFSGLREYRHGDHLRSIHWKSLPKLKRPQVKQFSDAFADQIWFDWDTMPGIDVETRLSRMTQWVLDADAGGQLYGLSLPGQRIAPASGVTHRLNCLRILALFDPQHVNAGSAP